MNKLFILFLFSVIVISIAIIMTYYFYEKPIQSEPVYEQYRNISIKMTENSTQASTGFIVVLDNSGIVYYKGNTSKQGYTFFRVPINKTFSVYNTNIKNQSYYTNRYSDSDTTRELVRIDFPLKVIGNFSVAHSGIFGVDEKISLKLLSKGEIQYFTICVRWSANIIHVNIPNIERGEPPKRLESKVDRCFYTKQPLVSDTTIPLEYRKLGVLTQNDYLEFYFLDGDIDYKTTKVNSGFVIEDEDKEDIGLEDVYYKIEFNK